MVIDTSAVIAIPLNEPDQRRYSEAIAAATISADLGRNQGGACYCMQGRKREEGRARLERFFQLTTPKLPPQRLKLAVTAFRRYGKGRHRAALNIGDCFSYALAVATGYPLLFKGNDFACTDIPSALSNTLP